jgi:MoaA/NifB/PqqE/SkfB family radical SAM enzyme
MLSILSKIPLFLFFRTFGWPVIAPINLTFSVSYKCNSRCKTCNVYTRTAEELNVSEWQEVFKQLGKTPFWTTISGGEPFLRKELPSIVCSLYDFCRPAIINIPTNGILTEKIVSDVSRIAEHCKKAQIVLNLSIDDIGLKHDELRGVKDNYEKVCTTFSKLKSLSYENLSIGIHTVISKYNVNNIPEIYTRLHSLNPDSYITEIAEEREELQTIGSGITPALADYERAIDYLIEQLRKEKFNKIGKITKVFRLEYYKMVKKILKEKRQIIPCYSGFASAQIAPDGDVWMCCVKAQAIGNLRDSGYSLKKIWRSAKAQMARLSIKNKECYCPLANAAYTNMLHDIPTLTKVSLRLLHFF